LAATIVRREQISIKPAIHDIGIYKDQIVEVDRDLERGLINKEEAKSAHNEVARRLLAADNALR
jgi:cytochrome c-type biogenesis protein CcmI